MVNHMPEDHLTRLTEEFDAAFRNLTAARRAYEDEPRDPGRIDALGAARTRLDQARSAVAEERVRLGLEPPWRVQPARTDEAKAPPLWSVDHGTSA